MERKFAAMLAVLVMMVPVAMADDDHHDDHFYDLAPYLVDGRLLVGGLDHDGHILPPPVYVFGFEFGPDVDPHNPYAPMPGYPGFNQVAGVGNLPAGATLRYDILSSLLYWDGQGDPVFGATPGEQVIELWLAPQKRVVSGDSGPQAGQVLATIGAEGTVHQHLIASLLDAPGTSNIPGDVDFVVPAEGIYALSIELTLIDGATSYTSDPIWLVYNHGASHHAMEHAMEVIPEPATLALLAGGALALLRRRRR